MTTRLRFAALILVVALGPACADNATAPTPIGGGTGARSGTWTGTFTDAASGTGTLRVDLSETAVGDLGLLAGSWTATFTSGAAAATGDVTGAITGSIVQITLRRAVPLPCAVPGALPALNGAFIATSLALAGGAISGPYVYQACGGPAAGTLELRRP